jgi:hypothetical protein
MTIAKQVNPGYAESGTEAEFDRIYRNANHRRILIECTNRHDVRGSLRARDVQGGTNIASYAGTLVVMIQD